MGNGILWGDDGSFIGYVAAVIVVIAEGLVADISNAFGYFRGFKRATSEKRTVAYRREIFAEGYKILWKYGTRNG